MNLAAAPLTNSSFLAMKRSGRSKIIPAITGSQKALWVMMTITGPVCGRFSAPRTRQRYSPPKNGIASQRRKVYRRVSPCPTSG